MQFELYLTRAFDEAFHVGQKPVDADTVAGILAPDLDGLEAAPRKRDPPNPDGSGRSGITFAYEYYLGAPLPSKEAIDVIVDAIRGKTRNNYKRSSTAPLELLLHSSGFSDVRWSPEPQFSDELFERVKRDRSVWEGSSERIWLLSGQRVSRSRPRLMILRGHPGCAH